MAEFKYPSSDFDNGSLLLGLLGSFWTNVYDGSDFVQALTEARATLDAQAHLNLLEMVASLSHFKIPVFHTENWYFLLFKESQVNNFEGFLTKFTNEATAAFTSDTTQQFGVPVVGTAFSVPVPNNLSDVKLLLNRITDSSLTLIAGIDFKLDQPGVLTFRENPFNNPLIPIQEIFSGNEVVDRQAGVWLFRGQWDWDQVYTQFGYALGLHLKSSEGYKELMSAVFGAITGGTKIKDIQQAWSAITGVALTREPLEQVETIATDSRSQLVITDRHVYKFPVGSNVIVTVGQQLPAGSPLVDTLLFYEFNTGQLSSDLTGLAFGRGILSNDFWGDLTFENKDVPLEVSTDSSGHTEVKFEIGGFPGDVEAFWDIVRTRGLTAGKSLANLLDLRASPIGEPTAAMLPPTINPLKFIVQNILRYHAFVVKLRSGLMPLQSLGLAVAACLKRIIPPHTLMLVLVELDYADEPIIMDGPGSETSPGYTESVSSFQCMVATDTLSPSLITEKVRLRQISGRCE